MKIKAATVILLCSILLFPLGSHATTVFETTGFIVGTQGHVFDFSANEAPFTYEATLTDLSYSPLAFDFLTLSVTTASETLGSIIGPGSFSFDVIPGKTYFANVFGIGGGRVDTGLFGINISSVPIPPSIVLLCSSLICLFGLRKKIQKQ